MQKWRRSDAVACAGARVVPLSSRARREGRLRAIGSFRDAGGSTADFSLGRRVDWFTSDASVALPEANGDVHCLSPGTATLSARDRKSGLTSTETGGDGVVSCTGA
jgi:hypothetical protein